MKVFILLTIFFFCSFFWTSLLAQCQDIPVADSSYESGSFGGGVWPPTYGYWSSSDGCNITTNNAYDGSYSACTNAGGAYQYIPVDSQTTYYLSFYVYNGLTSPPTYQINWNFYPFTVSSNNWTFVSQSFNSGSDTSIIIGFYSNSSGVCFDNFRVTCSPVIVGVNTIKTITQPYSIYPTVSSSPFTIELSKPCIIEIINLNGQVLEQVSFEEGLNHFGQNLPSSLYILRVFSGGKTWSEKIIKM